MDIEKSGDGKPAIFAFLPVLVLILEPFVICKHLKLLQAYQEVQGQPLY